MKVSHPHESKEGEEDEHGGVGNEEDGCNGAHVEKEHVLSEGDGLTSRVNSLSTLLEKTSMRAEPESMRRSWRKTHRLKGSPRQSEEKRIEKTMVTLESEERVVWSRKPIVTDDE